MPAADDPAAQPLKLRAIDQEDLMVMAAILQDAVTCISEMAFTVAEHRFLAAFLRFRREAGEGGALLRCQCALTVDHATNVRYRGIDKSHGRVRLELLTIDGEEVEDGARITLIFSGGAAIQIVAREIDVRLRDFGECLPALVQPEHPVVEGV